MYNVQTVIDIWAVLWVTFGGEFGFNIGPGVLFLDVRASGFVIDTYGSHNYNASSYSIDVGYKIGLGNR
ncbi:MAG: hypothetical protein LBH75_07755 [Treponema sp.]|nr:hypothetical protein [Treponema sp.]